ncbi:MULTISPECIES: hypothetical protein [Bacillus cereus group]|uniref:Uncharacterized protein n=1 Tax=Bacillus thuringiensis TaxID=1428 RepID=A0A9X7FVN3_BACTU|nr:hypothetical protein [Bacillus thuringiensis]MCQ6337685.1 hypothetical protein [Bacillus cereus]MCU7676404.1 hypothetical protein [Bacillus thuringiensis]PFT45335.1 hypothetical protein COK72_14625 [Bacillus thuringiensis]
MNKGTLQITEIEEISIPNVLKDKMKNLIDHELKTHNPYTCEQEIAASFSREWLNCLIDYSKKTSNSDMKKLLHMIKVANCGGNVPPTLIKNIPCDPMETLLPGENRKGFNYGEDEHDRMKKYFYAEWVTWLFATLFNYDALIHPSEHAGKNRFHLISPLNNDEVLRNVGASTGGGNFYQHNDATVYTDMKDQSDIEARLKTFNTNLEIVSNRLNKSVKRIVSEITCGKFTRVDALLLKGVLNLKTQTHIGTPKLLQKHLEENHFSKDDILAISKMPIAHIAGMADGEISGFVGEINQIIFLDDNGDIIATCLNGAENRLIYVGESEEEKLKFDMFLELLRTTPTYKVPLTSEDLLIIPNSYYGKQTNVTHGRERLSEEEYKIPIGDNKYGRRIVCRQYVSSRLRDQKESYFTDIIN